MIWLEGEWESRLQEEASERHGSQLLGCGICNNFYSSGYVFVS